MTLTENLMSTSTQYFDKTLALLKRIHETQGPAIERAADICAGSISRGGLVFMFGSGHSRMMCEEMAPRQGCFVGFYSWAEQAVSQHCATIGMNGLRAPLFLEKVEGYAEELLRGFKFGPHDAFIIVSTSGIRPLIVEMALGAKSRGMPTIGLTSVAHCSQSQPAHASGKKLIDIVDVVLDNQCPPGDCVVAVPGLDWLTGPTSTVTGAMLVNMLRCETADRLLKLGHKPVMLPSHQFVGNTTAHAAEEQLEAYYEGYRRSLSHLYQ
jgi:uncharacterized phosphosugar-binding protein